MKIFLFTGPNPKMESGVSWKIVRRGKVVTARWGPVSLEKRKVVVKGTLRWKRWPFRTEDAAKKDENRRIAEKLRKGYKRLPRGTTAR